jgi:hypothetical protein
MGEATVEGQCEVQRVNVQEIINREVIEGFIASAGKRGLSLHREAISVVAQPELSVMIAPLVLVEQVEVKEILKGQGFAGDVPVMYWYLSGEALANAPSTLRDGYYTLVVNQEQATSGLMNDRGQAVARGDLEICIDPQGPAGGKAERTISGKITSVSGSAWPPSIKVCGQFTIKEKGVTVKVNACITAGW